MPPPRMVTTRRTRARLCRAAHSPQQMASPPPRRASTLLSTRKVMTMRKPMWTSRQQHQLRIHLPHLQQSAPVRPRRPSLGPRACPRRAQGVLHVGRWRHWTSMPRFVLLSTSYCACCTGLQIARRGMAATSSVHAPRFCHNPPAQWLAFGANHSQARANRPDVSRIARHAHDWDTHRPYRSKWMLRQSVPQRRLRRNTKVTNKQSAVVPRGAGRRREARHARCALAGANFVSYRRRTRQHG